ncbi:MAG: type 4a pilus biogenesis protein PilO [Saccharofermentanales bacterium]|jgi:type IV pilus assembly protein PilO
MNPNVEKIIKLPLYQRLLILLVLLLSLMGVFVYFLYMPKMDELKQLQDKNAQLQTKLQEDQRIAGNLSKFKAEYEKMQEQLNQALTELPNQKEIPALLTSIAAVAKDNGLDILQFKPGNESPKGFYAEVPVDLKLSGSYHEAALFFNAVSSLSRIVNVSKVSLGNPKENDGKTMLSIDCLATTFRFLEETKGKK